ncbi:MAG: hypothetical protein B6V02_01675 [Thermoprotei archaeon ex4572_64]|nr:MAG: hypothetical protein B6V02_01675 [Thermoprotei archaeon ex4572_64]
MAITSLLILIMIVGTLSIYLMIRKRRVSTLNFLKVILLGIAIYTAIFLYLSITSIAEIPYPLLHIISALLTFTVMYLSLSIENVIVRALSTCLYSSLVGIFLILVLHYIVVLTLLIILVIYDVVMVYCGLLGRIIREVSTESKIKYSILRGLVLELDGFILGVGDLIMYSVLEVLCLETAILKGLSIAMIVCSALMTGLGVLSGYVLTVKYILPRKGYAPALSVPITLGIIPVIVLLIL